MRREIRSNFNYYFATLVLCSAYIYAWQQDIGVTLFAERAGRSVSNCFALDTRFRIREAQFSNTGWWIFGCPVFPELKG
jgi:hypothetical protein